MRAEAQVDAGICGFRATIYAVCNDGKMVVFDVDTDCEKGRHLADMVKSQEPIDAMLELDPYGEGAIMGAARSLLRGSCSSCVIPAGVFKAMEVATGVALPGESRIVVKGNGAGGGG